MVETQPAEEAAAYDTDGEPFLHERDVLYQSGESSEGTGGEGRGERQEGSGERSGERGEG